MGQSGRTRFNVCRLSRGALGGGGETEQEVTDVRPKTEDEKHSKLQEGASSRRNKAGAQLPSLVRWSGLFHSSPVTPRGRDES